ncbi:YqaA family protein [Azospirillum sp. ST 5-10]|uniref:YqaA family protein n=1 Tax=unclassified Azospirillum TaxID=2630922 RepID=UPI003F4A46E1
MNHLVAYGSLFLTSLGAATFLPIQSEFVLIGLYLSGDYSNFWLLVISTVGNTLGSTVNWALGRYIEHFKDRRWFPIKPALIERASGWYERWGAWSLLLAWAPFIGDPLTFAAGILRVNFWLFVSLVAMGKMMRYALVMTAL